MRAIDFFLCDCVYMLWWRSGKGITLKLELWAVVSPQMWVPGTEFGFSGKALLTTKPSLSPLFVF